jgi:uncharacterized protein YccT (UPF0319 family)
MRLSFAMRLSAVAVIFCASLLSAGCDNQRVHELYRGSPEQAVFVEANDTVLVSHIDAEEQDTAFIGQKNRYRLAPGTHTMVVEYAALFQIDADRHEKLTSPPVKVTFEAKPGHTYRFRHVEQKTLEEARAFAKSPTLELVALPDNTVVNATFEKSLPTRFLPKVAFENSESYGFVSEQKSMATPGASSAAVTPVSGETAVVPGSGTLESLKNLWEKATPEQRGAFREWLKKQ